MQKYIILILISLVLCGEDDISGSINSYYASRLSDGTLINLPFRVADVKWQRETSTKGYFLNFIEGISFYSHMALEYRLPSDTSSFVEIINPLNFTWDLRELYFTWHLSNGEIRLGKQIHSWGSVDANSPLDNLNANDYYYMFSVGSEQKMGSYSIAADYYVDDWKFGVFFSPFHHASRLPISDSQFPMKLPANPTSKQIIEVADPMEYAADITKSFDKGDITLSYFNGYDRVFSPLGFNAWDNRFENHDVVLIDTVYSYRKTEVFGLGSVVFFGDLTLRGDVAYFTTKDRQINTFDLDFLAYDLPSGYDHIRTNDSKVFNAKAEYFQTNIQFELSLSDDIQFIGQYITYDTLQYSDDLGHIYLDLPAVNIDYNPPDFFMPGLGTGLAILTKEVFLIDVTKQFNDNSIKLNLKAMLDKVDSGKLFEMGVNYKITESLNSYFAITKIFGDSRQNDTYKIYDASEGVYKDGANKYEFNQMEDFSHIRMELKYYY